MPAVVEKHGSLYRVVRSEDGKIIRGKRGHAIDGGGHKLKNDAVMQACQINTSLKFRDDIIKNTMEDAIFGINEGVTHG